MIKVKKKQTLFASKKASKTDTFLKVLRTMFLPFTFFNRMLSHKRILSENNKLFPLAILFAKLYQFLIMFVINIVQNSSYLTVPSTFFGLQSLLF